MTFILPRPAAQHHATRYVAALLALWAALSCNMQAHAQSAADTPPSQVIPDVVVQSGRLAQRQFDAPASIYNLDSAAIHNGGAEVNLSDSLAQVPGVVALNRSNYAQDNMLSVRGFGAHVAVGFGGVRLISDGIPAITPDGQGQTSTIDLAATDRIEVLKGPLGQMYGNASGGVIQTFTREAGNDPTLQVKMLTGSWGLRRTDTFVSERFGQVGAVADLNTFDITGYRANADAQRQQFNSVITSDLQPDTRLKVVINSFDGTAHDPLGLTAAQLASNPTAAGTNALLANARKDVHQNQVGMVLDQALGPDLNLQARAYGGIRNNLQYQASSGSTITAAGTWITLGRTYSGLGLQLNGKQSLNPSQRMDWVVGMDNDRADENRQMGSAASGLATTGATRRNELDRSSNQDYFAQANWHLGERWTLVTGARRSQVLLDSQSYLSSYTAGNSSYSAVTPVLGLTWHVRDDLNLYANQGKGFETPTLLQTAYQAGVSAPIPTFNPNLLASTSHQAELGAKWTPDAATRIDAALFNITTDNEIVISQSANGQTAYSNAGQTLRRGVEAALSEQWTQHWRSQLSLTAMQATYQSAFSTAGGTIASGNHLAGVPGRQAFAAMQWSQRGFATPGQPPALGLEVALEAVARSQLWANDLNTASAGGYSLYNLRARNRFEGWGMRWEAYASIENLANRAYVGSVIVNQSNGQYYEPGLPRAWMVGLQGNATF